MCLTERKTNYVYKTVEEGNVINTNTVMCETEQNQDYNPYKKVVLIKFTERKTSPQK